MIRVVVISGICLYREGLAEMLDRTGAISVVGSASDVAEGLTLWNGLDEPPDVILLDTVPADADVPSARSLAALPDVRVLALAVPNQETEILAVAEAGIAGFVTSDASVAELVAAIESVARGEALCTPSVAAALMRRLASLARSWAETDPIGAPDQARAGDPRADRRGALEQADRAAAPHRAADREEPRAPHPRQARSPPAGRGRRAGTRARVRE